MVNIEVIVACDNNKGIGKNIRNRLYGNVKSMPWSCSEDLKHFKYITKNNIVVMGRTTIQGIPVILQNRIVFVLSRKLYDNKRDPYIILSKYLLIKNGNNGKYTQQDVENLYRSVERCKTIIGVNYCYVFNDIENMINFIDLYYYKKSYMEKDDPNFNKIDMINTVNNMANTPPKVFIAGGGEVYLQFFNIYRNMIKYLHLTVIDKDYNCDTFITEDLTKWYTLETKQLVKREKNIKVPNNITINNVISPKYRNFRNNINEDVVYYKKVYNPYGENGYLNLLNDVLENGNFRKTRNSNVISLFNKHMTYDLTKGFPLLTTKKMFFRGIVEELLFFLRGNTNSKKLEERGINIWKGNTSKEFLEKNILTSDYSEGEMGPMYGYLWRNYGKEYIAGDSIKNSVKNRLKNITENIEKHNNNLYTDQLKNVLDLLKNDPFSRRILMTTYDPSVAEEGVLYPCHSLTIQFYVETDFYKHDKIYYLDMFCYNRSSDLFLGLPFNIASSALLLTIIAKCVGYTPRFLHLSLGDCHIYENHIIQVNEQIKRTPYVFPTIKLSDNINRENLLESRDDIELIKYEDFTLENYNFHPPIKAQMIS